MKIKKLLPLLHKGRKVSSTRYHPFLLCKLNLPAFIGLCLTHIDVQIYFTFNLSTLKGYYFNVSTSFHQPLVLFILPLNNVSLSTSLTIHYLLLYHSKICIFVNKISLSILSIIPH